MKEALDKLSNNSLDDMKAMTKVIERNINSNLEKKKITIPTGNELIFPDIDEILRCHSDINYTTIYKNDGQKIVITKTLKEFEEMLHRYGFFRIHNSDLINLAYIKSYNKRKGAQ